MVPVPLNFIKANQVQIAFCEKKKIPILIQTVLRSQFLSEPGLRILVNNPGSSCGCGYDHSLFILEQRSVT